MSAKIDFKEIEKIINLIDERNLAEFELEIEGFKIRIAKNPPVSPSTIISKEEKTQLSPSETEEAIPESTSNNIYYVKSPIVGTFYQSPDPSSPPYVEEGDKVEKNQVLCIVEAMKLMNEIESEVEGVIKKIYVENGQPVEYGQKLFAIQPSK
ncbi:MAG: acetyl-CoA carboxylase biotin carboxyl carrier protein [Candidatus Aminicenantia bacterium]